MLGGRAACLQEIKTSSGEFPAGDFGRSAMRPSCTGRPGAWRRVLTGGGLGETFIQNGRGTTTRFGYPDRWRGAEGAHLMASHRGQRMRAGR